MEEGELPPALKKAIDAKKGKGDDDEDEERKKKSKLMLTKTLLLW